MKASLSPAVALARFIAAEISTGLTLISGPRGAGKTSWCADLAAQAGALGLTVAGVLCPARLEDGRKTGIDLVDLRTGERRLLGWREETGAAGLPVGCWRFDAEVLHRGNAILAQSADADVLIIDELGPLEFDEGGGFQAGLRLLDEGRYRAAWVVVRPELLARARARWPLASVMALGEGGQ